MFPSGSGDESGYFRGYVQSTWIETECNPGVGARGFKYLESNVSVYGKLEPLKLGWRIL